MDNQEPMERELGITVRDVIRFFRRYSVWMCLGGVLAAAAAVLGLEVLPQSWESGATLVVVPPGFSSELKPSTLSVQAYQMLLESDAVVGKAKEQLQDQQVIEPEDRLRIGDELHTRILVSRRGEERSLAPVIRVLVRWSNADTAARIANTWAHTFLDHMGELMAGTTSPTVKLIDAQYEVGRKELIDLEDGYVEAADGFREQLDEAADRWDGRITEHKQETNSLLADYWAETQGIVEEYRVEHDLDAREARRRALRSAQGELEEEQARVSSQLERSQLTLASARDALENQARTLELRKAITDEALWDAIAREGEEKRWSELGELSLVTEAPNPTYELLAEKVAEAEVRVNQLRPWKNRLERELETTSADLRALETSLAEDQAELERIKAEREAGLDNLKEERKTRLEILKRARERELSEIENARDNRLKQLERDVNHQRARYGELAKSKNEAILAEAEQGLADVRLGAEAVPPDQPMPRHGLVKVLLAAVLGAFVVGLWGVAREVVYQTP